MGRQIFPCCPLILFSFLTVWGSNSKFVCLHSASGNYYIILNKNAGERTSAENLYLYHTACSGFFSVLTIIKQPWNGHCVRSQRDNDDVAINKEYFAESQNPFQVGTK